jgi:hypothetical protein
MHKDIHIIWNPATGGFFGTNEGGQGNSAPGRYCRACLTEPQPASGANQQPQQSARTTLEKYTECMGADGTPDVPDPTNGTRTSNAGGRGDLNASDSRFQNASKLCAQGTGAHVPGVAGTPPPATIMPNGQAPPGSAGLDATSRAAADG